MVHQQEAINNREMISPNAYIRLKKYIERWVNPLTEESHRPTKEVFFYTNDMASCISELVSHSPVKFIVNGKESDFLKKMLFEYSYIKEQLPIIYRELMLSTKAYMICTEKIAPKNDANIKKHFVFEIPKTEDVWEEVNPITGKPIKIIVKQKKQILNDKQELNEIYIVRIFDLDGVTTSVTDSGGGVVDEYPTEYVENPYKNEGLLQCLSFKSVTDSTGLPMSSKLREYQLQIDNLDSNVQNIINLYGSPMHVVKHAVQNWDDITLGAGMVVALQMDEELETVTAKAQLNEIQLVYDKKVDNLYKSAGLIRLEDRSSVYSSDSAKVTKLAHSESIGQIESILESSRSALDDLVIMALKVNGIPYTDEIFEAPTDIMPVDLDSAFQTIAMALNTKVWDMEEVYKRYFQDMNKDDKERIALYWKVQDAYALELQEKSNGAMNPKETNTSTTAKVDSLAKSMAKKKPMSQSEANKAENKEARGDAGKTTVR